MDRSSYILSGLVVLTLLLTAADHWTTYVCLRAPLPGWQVTEANPIAAWLFHSTGLVPGILIDTAVTGIAIAALLLTRLVSQGAKRGFFAAVVLWTGWAVANNVQAIVQMGIAPFEGA
jgi:hypothetical protein